MLVSIRNENYYTYLQATRWLQIHGLSHLGRPCTHECGGIYQFSAKWNLLRCSVCWAKKSSRGEFFSHYKSIAAAVMLIWAIVKRWRPGATMEEMQFKDRHRYGAMLEHIGTICKFALEIGFKHQLGRWDYAVIDESATGLPLSLCVSAV